MRIAYRLRDEYRGTPAIDPETGEETDELVGGFEGGVIGVPPRGEPFDVGEALEQGGGLIVVEEASRHLVIALDSYDALERTEAPAEAAAVGYSSQRKAALVEELERRNIEGVSSKTKAEIVDVLTRHDELVAAGDPNAHETVTKTPEED